MFISGTNGTFIMNSHSTVSSNQGHGGVMVQDGATFTMNNNAVISGNTSTRAAGVFVSDGGTFILKGGTIYGNCGPPTMRNIATEFGDTLGVINARAVFGNGRSIIRHSDFNTVSNTIEPPPTFGNITVTAEASNRVRVNWPLDEVSRIAVLTADMSMLAAGIITDLLGIRIPLPSFNIVYTLERSTSPTGDWQLRDTIQIEKRPVFDNNNILSIYLPAGNPRNYFVDTIGLVPGTTYYYRLSVHGITYFNLDMAILEPFMNDINAVIDRYINSIRRIAGWIPFIGGYIDQGVTWVQRVIGGPIQGAISFIGNTAGQRLDSFFNSAFEFALQQVLGIDSLEFQISDYSCMGWNYVTIPPR